MKLRQSEIKSSTVILIVFLLMLAVSGAYIAYKALATANPKPYSTSLYLSPATAKIGKGKILKVTIWENSGTQPVNAVQANLSYDVSKFQFVNIDATSSAFNIEAQSTGASGKIYIARGQVSPVKGKQVVANINLKVLASSSKTSLSFTSKSALLRSTDNHNILTMAYKGTYTLTR